MNDQDVRAQRIRVAFFVVATLALLVVTILVLGHSESLFKVSESYTPIGKTVYRRA